MRDVGYLQKKDPTEINRRRPFCVTTIQHCDIVHYELLFGERFLVAATTMSLVSRPTENPFRPEWYTQSESLFCAERQKNIRVEPKFAPPD